ncbi:hypothetical protein DPEC_G00367660 [Dallia pectoralis]|nr:hypothetical protein DPEC_G00367660 [Dallia pectoralis]
MSHFRAVGLFLLVLPSQAEDFGPSDGKPGLPGPPGIAGSRGMVGLPGQCEKRCPALALEDIHSTVGKLQLAINYEFARRVNKTYFVSHKRSGSFDEAVQFCTKMGLALALPKNEKENVALTEIFEGDVQFYHFMHHVTDLKKKEILMTFNMLDWNASGEIDFDQFYMLVCILLCSEYNVEKNFISRYPRVVFKLLDMDGNGTISPAEFMAAGFLFNFEEHALNKIFYEFDVSGDQRLNYKEFKKFAMACIEMQEESKKKQRK